MQNPFDLIIEDLKEIKSKISISSAASNTLPTEIINRDELCKRLTITEPTCIRWEKKNRIPSFRIGHSVRYNWPSVIEALENKKRGQK